MCWNARSVYNKTSELIDFIIKNNIDFAAICETHLSTKVKFKVKGYIVYRFDRNRYGGGVALIVRENIQHYQIIVPSLVSAEAVAIKITGADNIVFASVYIPHKLSVIDLNTLFSLGNKVCLAGDFNSRHLAWNCFGNNLNGKMLLEYSIKHNIVLHAPEEPTYLPSHSLIKPSILDMFITKNLNIFAKPSVTVDLCSDHLPVTISTNCNFEELPKKYVYNYAKSDWEMFQEHLNNSIPANPTILTVEDIDNLLMKLNNEITIAVKKSTPRKEIKPFNYKIPANISKLIKIKNFLRKKSKIIKYKALKVCINKLNNVIPKLINLDKNNKWSKFLSSLSPKDNSLWRINKYFTKSNNSNIMPPLTVNQKTVFSSAQKAELLADNFENVHKQNINLSSVYYTNQVHKEIRKVFSGNIVRHSNCDLTSPSEVKEIIKKLKNKKAPGDDGITSLLIKKLPNKTIVYVTKLFNYMFLFAYFPTEWKTAKIIALPKPGKDPSNPKSYRPISLLCTLSKIFEKLIQKRMMKHIHANNLLSDMQFGFRRERSTVTQLFRVLDSITHNFNLNKHTGMVLLDIEKAFDCVWIKGLIYILISLKFPLYIVYLINSYLKNRKFFVIINDLKSTIRAILAGVPQGSVLGPILFILYIDKISKILIKGVHLAAFADDTIAYKHSYRIDTIVNHLQKTTSNCLRFFNKWKIRANESKTEAIIFTKRRPVINSNILVNNKAVEWCSYVKYLGVILDTRLTFTKHIDTQCHKAIGALVKLFPLLNRDSSLNIKNKILLYKTVIRPILTYAAPVWSNTCAANYKKLQVVQNKCLRVIGNFSRSTSINVIHEKLNVEYIKDFIICLTQKFCAKTENSQDIFVRSITNYSRDSLAYKRYKHKRLKHILLE